MRRRPDPEELIRRYGLQDNRRENSPVIPVSSASPDISSVTQGTQGGYAEEEDAEVHHGPGRLRVYLAAAAGAGKTYAMLNEGHRREGRGSDVVIGYVETHRRRLTEAQIGDLEVIPRKKISYRGVTLEEMDAEAVIARHPMVARV